MWIKRVNHKDTKNTKEGNQESRKTGNREAAVNKIQVFNAFILCAPGVFVVKNS
jgi:hypothetical protein